MLRQRVITAIILLAILLPAMFYTTPEPFCAVALVLIAAGGWEWGRVNACSSPVSILLGLAVAALCGLTWYAGLLGRPLPLLWTLAGGCAGSSDWRSVFTLCTAAGLGCRHCGLRGRAHFWGQIYAR